MFASDGDRLSWVADIRARITADDFDSWDFEHDSLLDALDIIEAMVAQHRGVTS